MLLTINTDYVLNALVFSVLGVLILFICFWIFERLTPENLWKMILVEKNVALAVLAAGFMLAIAHIIASAIHG
jgi:putative membrane protein